jgi:hypothetical protein
MCGGGITKSLTIPWRRASIRCTTSTASNICEYFYISALHAQHCPVLLISLTTGKMYLTTAGMGVLIVGECGKVNNVCYVAFQ